MTFRVSATNESFVAALQDLHRFPGPTLKPYTEHQLCCAYALRELQGVADTAAPDSD